MVYPLTAAVLGRAGPREFAARLYCHVPLRLVHCWDQEEEGEKDEGQVAEPSDADGGVVPGPAA
jgi:hypothetical protein